MFHCEKKVCVPGECLVAGVSRFLYCRGSRGELLRVR